MSRIIALLAVIALSVPCATWAQASKGVATSAALRASTQQYVATHEPAILREFTDLLALPNVAADHTNIRRNADLLVASLKKRGVDARLLEFEGAPPTVYGELKVPGAKRTVIFYAHYDGQPVIAAQWTTPPWTPTLRDAPLEDGGKPIALPTAGAAALGPNTRIYARSAGDDKGTIMAMLAALDALHAARREPSVNLKFFFEGEEEAGSPHILGILQKYKGLLAADMLLLGDGPVYQNGEQQLLFGVRGDADMELTVFGATRALHSGHYGNWAPNAGVLLANLIASMRDDNGHIKIDGYYADVAPVTAAEQAAIKAMPPIDAELRTALGLARTEANDAPLEERLMLPALNLRGFDFGAVGEHARNVIPTEAKASFDFRLVPNQTPAHLRELVTRHIESQGYFVTPGPVTREMRLAHARVAQVVWGDGAYPADRVSMTSPAARALIAATSDDAGKPPILVPTSGGSSPNYAFTQTLRVPVINVPIANYDDNQHAADENLRLQNLRNGIELYTQIFAHLGTTGW